MHRAVAAALAALALALVAPAAAGAASFPANATLVLDGTADLLHPPAAGLQASSPSLSSDGRYAVYLSFDFSGPPGTANASVVRRDLLTGQATTVNVAQDGTPLPVLGITSNPRISGDGQHVAFAAFTPGGPTIHIYERDLSTNPPRTLIADRFADSGTVTPVNSQSFDPTISDDGSRVAFLTFTPLDPVADRDGGTDVYVRDFRSNQTLLIDRGPGELAAKAVHGVRDPIAALSGDGQHVVFNTEDALDPAHDTGTDTDVYVRNLDTFTTTLASVAGVSDKGNGTATPADISRDGNRVLFASDGTTFGVTDGSTQLYVRDLQAHTLELASRADGVNGAPVSASFTNIPANSISADGRHVVWSTVSQTPVVPGIPGTSLRVYERDLAGGNAAGGVTRLISRASGPAGAAGNGASGPAPGDVSAEGGCVAFTSDGALLTPPQLTTGVIYSYLRVLEPDCGRPAPGPGPGPGPGGPGPGPAKPALLSALSLKPARFFVGGAKGGTRIAFRLDKASSVTLSVDRLAAGRLKGRRCLTTVRAGKRCTLVRHAGSLALVAGRAGANTVKFSGKLGRRALLPGTYRLTATPLHGVARTVRFVVVKAPKPTRKARR
jgi:Tol biopolymer transport system component